MESHHLSMLRSENPLHYSYKCMGETLVQWYTCKPQYINICNNLWYLRRQIIQKKKKNMEDCLTSRRERESFPLELGLCTSRPTINPCQNFDHLVKVTNLIFNSADLIMFSFFFIHFLQDPVRTMPRGLRQPHGCPGMMSQLAKPSPGCLAVTLDWSRLTKSKVMSPSETI